MLHSKNVQDAAVSGRRLGVIVHQRRTASSWNRRWPSIYNCKLFSLGLRDEQRRAIWEGEQEDS